MTSKLLLNYQKTLKKVNNIFHFFNIQIGITIWDVYDATKRRAVGATTVSVFGKHGFVTLFLEIILFNFVFRKLFYIIRVHNHNRAYFVYFYFSILRQGIHDLRVWPGKEADGDTGTPGKFSKESGNEMSKLAKVSTKYYINTLRFFNLWRKLFTVRYC